MPCGHDEKWSEIFDALRQEGYSKERAAKIATTQRQRMKKMQKNNEIKLAQVFMEKESEGNDPFAQTNKPTESEEIEMTNEIINLTHSKFGRKWESLSIEEKADIIRDLV